ncbi:MAG: STT3 domain-containing protein [Candidatus Thorarchaeota archaeon]|nr:STT3 domain-containing protein [Candidatus Thorarchaeota archaeon]
MSRFSKFKRSSVRLMKQVFHRPKAKISRGSALIVSALTIIFIAALALRLEPLIDAQPIVRAFDPWFQLKVTEYVAENGFGAFFTWYDQSTWVPFGRDITTTSYIGVPFTSAFFYWVVNAMGIPVSVTTVSILLPAFMGALTTLVAYLLGREVFNNTVGMLSALFMAFLPAFIQRTIVGFYDNELVGVFAITLTMFLFLRSLKRGSALSGVAAGFALAYLLASWGAGDFILGLFALYGMLMLIGGKYSKRLLTSYLLTVTLGIFLGVLVPRNGFSSLTSMTYLAAIGVGGLLAFYEIWQRIATYREATATVLTPHMKPIVLGAISPIIGIVAYIIYGSSSDLSITTTSSNPITVIGSKFMNVINPFFRLDQRIFASVAEHLPSPWGSFYQTLLVLIIFFPLGMYFLYSRGRDEDLFLLLFGATAVYFTGSMIRLSLILAPAAAILAAIAVNGILAPFAKVVTQQSVFERRRFRMSSSLTSEHAIAAFAFVGLLLSVNIILGVAYVSDGIRPPEFASAYLSDETQVTDWQTSMTYIRNVLPPGATIASWWDYGYWINSASGADTIVDNGTLNATQIALMGYALMSLNFTESLRTLQNWNTTHVLVYWGHRTSFFGGDDGKWPWMVRIAEDHLGSDLIDDATYLGDDPSTPDYEETEWTKDAFFESTLYKLMLYGEPHTIEEGQQMGLAENRLAVDQYLTDNENDPRWTDYIPTDLYGVFDLSFISYQYGLVKIYSVDYTMLEQYNNKTSAQWAPEFDALSSISMDGNISASESGFTSNEVVFGGGYDATVYTRANATHMYYGISMDNYTVGEDALGIQVSSLDNPDDADIRIVNYDGHDTYDGYIDYYGDWSEDTGGSNSTEYATGENVIEFLIPLNSEDSQDLNLKGGMNYQIKFMFFNNVNSGDPTLDSDWITFWVPVELH